MMFSRPRVRPITVAGALGVVPLLAGGLVSAGSLVSAGAAAQERQTAQHARHAAVRYSEPLDVDNRMFPLKVGTQFVYQGKIVEGGKATPHSVVFTVTDVSKVVDHVRTVVAWDRDFLKGKLQEQELAFFAQDDKGNVWNFGEYPEEYENGKFAGAPSTWIKDTAGAYGGIHMLAHPKVGMRYREGLVPAIEFDDVSLVTRTHAVTCVRTGCYRHVLVIDETSPNDPSSGHQIKYYAPRTGLVRVGARGGDSREFLTLVAVRHLGRCAMAKVRAAVLAMDRRAYRISKVYRTTGPAQRRHTS
jgi:hypothetical protein